MKTKYLLASLPLFLFAQTAFADVCVIQYGYFAGKKALEKLTDSKLGVSRLPEGTKVAGSDTEKGVLKTCGINNEEFLIEPVHFMSAPSMIEAMTEVLSKMRAEGYRVVSCDNLNSCIIEK